MSSHKLPVTIMLPAFNADKYIVAAIRSLLDQTFTDFEMIISDNASEDNTEAICREFAAKDERIRYVRNPVNVGANRNFCNILALSKGNYLLIASDHDLWRPDLLEHYLAEFEDNSDTILVYSPATVIAATGEILRVNQPDTPRDTGKYSTFFNVFSGAINSTAINGLIKKDALLKTSIHTSLGPDTLMLAELSLYGNFRQLPQSYYFRRQNRPPESPRESAIRYIATLFKDPPEVIKAMPYTHMVYKALCMVQNNDLSFQDQRQLNAYILSIFTGSWGITLDSLTDIFLYMKDHSRKSTKENTTAPQTTQNSQKPERMVLDIDTFLKTVHDGPYSDLGRKYHAHLGTSIHQNDFNSGLVKKWNSDKQYDVCYLLYDSGKWGGVKGTIAQANGLVDRGYRVCIVCRTAKPDWIDVRADFIVSPNISENDIPLSDIIVGTLFLTVPPGVSSKKGICIHYCRGYEALPPGLSKDRKSEIENVYKLPTNKIANSPHVGKFLKENFPGEVYIVHNDIDHSVFYPNRKRNWGEGTIRVLIVGPYEVAWKGVRNCLEACRIFRKIYGVPIKIIRASQSPSQPEENQLAQESGCPYEYKFNLSDVEMATLYNECDILLSGSYPYVESFGRPAMEALACGLPVVLTNIPAYRDYDETHDFALFVEPADARAMAETMHKIVKDVELREQLIQRGIEVSSNYSIERTVDELDRTLQDIYRKHDPGVDRMSVNRQYYGFSRPEVQAMVDPKAGKILDVGCASGKLGAELKDRLGAEVWGVEIVESIAKEAETRLDRVIHGSIEEAIPALPEVYFDAVILADVLEHLYDPYTLLKTIKTKLTPIGEVIASIPNIRHWSVLKELIEGRWDYQEAGILDHTHLRFFTKQSITALFDNAGLEIKDMKATMLQGTEVPKDVIKALSATQLDVSTLKEEGNHYQYLVRASAKKTVKDIVSIVILTFNQLDYTKKCVKSIRKHTPEAHEIIFVDNGSTDGTVKWLRNLTKESSNYVLIENGKNLGFAKGCNQGIRKASGEFIMLLNNDVIVTENWLSGMLECLNSAPDTGIIGPMTNNISGLQQVKDDTYRSIEHLGAYARNFRETYRHRRIPLMRIVGFCMLFRRDLVDKIGMLDESFGTGNFEDDDLCFRTALEGYRNLVAGDVFIHHFGSASFIGNKIDHRSAMVANKKTFNEKWTLGSRNPLWKKMAVLSVTGMAAELYHKGLVDRAVDVLINCIKISPDEKNIYYELARMFIESKRFSEASQVFESMPESIKNNLKSLECAGYIKEGLGLDAEADSYAEMMLALDQGYAPAINLKGILAYKKENPDKAEAYFKNALESDPGFGEAHTNLGVLKCTAGEKDEALAYLSKGFSLSPTVPDHRTLYYSAISSSGAYGDAESFFREAKRLYPTNKNIAFLYIDILIQQEKFSLAINEIEDAIITFGLDDNILNAALSVREKAGPRRLDQKGFKKASLSLSMIVKNEEEHIANCLRSVRDVVDEMIVVDTGSTDRTKEIARAFGALVFEFPWTGDFSEARNHSLSKADGDWILILDADEVISPLDFKELKGIIGKSTPSPRAYSIITRNYVNDVSTLGCTQNMGQYPEEAGAGWVPTPKVRLFRKNKNIFFSNPVHELLEPSLTKARIPIRSCGVVVHHYGKLMGERELKKGEDYYLLGKIKLENEPENLKFIQELARQAYALRKYDETIELLLQLIDALKTNPDSKAYDQLFSLTKTNPYAETYLELASAYLMLDRYEEALSASRKAMENPPTPTEAVQTYAYCEIVAGSVDNAFVALDGLLNTSPDHPQALVLLGVVFCIQGQSDKMRELFKTLLQRRINVATGLNSLAKKLRIRGKNDQAMLILNAMIENNLSDQETIGLLDEAQKPILIEK